MVLTLLAILVAALLALAALAGAVGRAAVTGTVSMICAATVVLAAVALGGGGAAMALPIGPAGTATHLALDPLAACFLLLLFLVLPCTGATPIGLAGVAITLLAADSFALAVGLLLLGGSSRLRATVVAAGGSCWPSPYLALPATSPPCDRRRPRDGGPSAYCCWC